MPSDPADRRFQAGRPRWWAAGLVLSLVVAVGVYLVVGRDQTAVLPSQQPSAGSTDGADDQGADTRADAAVGLLAKLGDRLEHGSLRDVVALAAPGDADATRELGTLRANVRALGITDLAMRYVDEDDGRLSAEQEHPFKGRAWVGDVQLAWRIRGFDRHDAHREVTLTFVETSHGAAFVTARHSFGDAAPLWMLERLQVLRTPRSLVATTSDDSPKRFSRLADQAVVDVRKVLPGWAGRLVVEVPGDEQELGRVLGSDQGYGGIAAVTTTVDGSLSPDAPVHIFVNPPVFDPLGPRGSQIVMSHEATHVATGAAVSSMPTWLLEGFADFVALDHVDLPVSVTASQILAQVRKKGPPARLPGRTEFDPQNQALGASYEAAWLACRLLGKKYGEKRLITFYRASDRAGSTTGPFHTLLHTDQRAFTAAWRSYLRRLAG